MLEFASPIKEICSNNETCWILLTDCCLLSYNFLEKSLLNHQSTEIIISIACTATDLYFITTNNNLRKFTNGQEKSIHEFPKHQKIKKLVTGAEHCLLLTSNGDVFSVGCGLRGTLGHGDVNSCDTPKQIEGLAGLKIVDIAAGLFHSIAVSSFGDVYTWGWNTHGQLGLPKIARHTFEKASDNHQQVFTVPQLIELEDDEAVEKVFCGSRHTVLKTERNRIFSAGLNNYGQLGLSSKIEDVDKFTEIPVSDINDDTRIVCGFWATYLLK